MSNQVLLRLEAPLTIQQIARSKSILGDALAQANTIGISLELAPHAEVDVSFIQMIASARAHAESMRKHLRLAAPAAGKLLHVLKRAGFIEGASLDDLKFWLHSENAQ